MNDQPDWLNLHNGVVVGFSGPYAQDGRYVRVGELPSEVLRCGKCGRGVKEIGGYLERVNEKGVPGIWECRPNCDADLPFETNLELSIDGDKP